jgi:hypothetical protein
LLEQLERNRRQIAEEQEHAARTRPVVEWAYRAIADPPRRPARIEVGEDLFEALRATVPQPPDGADEDELPDPRFRHHILLGIRLTVSDELAGCGWRTYDHADRVISEGTFGGP